MGKAAEHKELTKMVICQKPQRKEKMSAKEQTLRHIKFNSMSTRQAVKWFLLHERERHVDDILAIDRDLKKLKDVELPPDILNETKARFEV